MKMINMLYALITKLLIIIVRLYQYILSPFLGSNCRFLPTCSEYTIESLKLHGPIKGLTLSITRICSCHPLGKKGYDPVKTVKNKQWMIKKI